MIYVHVEVEKNISHVVEEKYFNIKKAFALFAEAFFT